MKAHELARRLLEGPNLEVITEDQDYSLPTSLNSVDYVVKVSKSECKARDWPESTWEPEWGSDAVLLTPYAQKLAL